MSNTQIKTLASLLNILSSDLKQAVNDGVESEVVMNFAVEQLEKLVSIYKPFTEDAETKG